MIAPLQTAKVYPEGGNPQTFASVVLSRRVVWIESEVSAQKVSGTETLSIGWKNICIRTFSEKYINSFLCLLFMPKITRKRLKEKGWEKHEIEKTMNVLEIDKLRTHQMEENMHKLMYWMSLVALTLLNIIGVVFLVPLIIILEGVYLYSTVMTFGIVFGLLFNYLILGIEHLEAKHHIIAWILVPLLGVFDIYLMSVFTRKVEIMFELTTSYNVPVMVVCFIGAFVLPYFVFIVMGKHKFKFSA